MYEQIVHFNIDLHPTTLNKNFFLNTPQLFFSQKKKRRKKKTPTAHGLPAFLCTCFLVK